ncbi:MAG: peptidylprolyl isomerase [Motiliproteus sp.]|nr:peptidylprolyl isomerase [Motiliproteus sp.]MCW9053221.1 peptidylprolyl isomerase [Motiliproteus sp.]
MGINAQEQNTHKVRMQTNMGVIILQLNAEKAPNTVANFENYVNKGYYDGLIFHRIIDNFMIQGGGFRPGLVEKKADAPIKNESDNGLSNTVGTIAMARRQDPHSASSQFYINVNNNSALDYGSPQMRGWGYTVFGKVIEGMDVVNKIKSVTTMTTKYVPDVPLKDVIIEKVEMVQ